MSAWHLFAWIYVWGCIATVLATLALMIALRCTVDNGMED